jgi:hypothetical protein
MTRSKSGKDLEMLVATNFIKSSRVARHWCLMPAILATQEAEIRRIKVQSQPRQIVHETLSQKYPTHTHTHKGW